METTILQRDLCSKANIRSKKGETEVTSRERLFLALSGQVPDRVPISTYELVGYNSLAWENNDPSYARLMQVIREKTDCICMWNPSSNITFFESSYPADVELEEWREGNATFCRRTLHTPKGDLTQTTKILDNVHTVWQIEHWCKNIEDVNRALAIPYEPVSYDASDFPRIKAEVGENGIIMTSIADPLWLAADLMDFGEYTIWALTETKHFARTVQIMHERHMENLKRMLEVNVVDLYRICGPEYATPPFLLPEFFARFVTPYVSEMVSLIHRKEAKVRLHCHGRIAKVLDMILETGADAIDPCEAPPDGDITLAELKKRVNNRMSVFGNIQLKVLEHGTAPEVEIAVRECIASAKKGGGYVIMPTAAPINSPLAKRTEENYIHFIETALKYGWY